MDAIPDELGSAATGIFAPAEGLFETYQLI
jgi:hypothetical protein